MALQTEKSGQIVRRAAPEKEEGLVRLLRQLQPEMERALPKHLTADRMARLALTALRTVKDLDKCTPQSFAACVMACSALGLECNTPLGEAYLIPRTNHGTKECTLIVGYFGMMSLARRSGMVASIQAFPVYKGDRFEYEQGLTPKLVHVPSSDPDRDADSKNLTHAYAIARLKDAGSDPVFVVMSRAQIDRRRARGASGFGAKTPWDTDFVSMAQKTAVRELFKWAPRSAEMARAEAIEVATERGTSVIRELPEETAHALLGAGIAPDDVTDDGEVLDAALDSSPTATRQPGEDDD
jgi:recombination protein RecT